MWLGLTIFVGVLVVAVGLASGDLERGSVEEIELPLWALAVSVVFGNWTAFIGWPWIVSRWKGLRSLARDFGLEFHRSDLGWGLLAGVICLGLSIGANLLYVVATGVDEAPSNAEFLPEEPESALVVVGMFVLVALGTPVAEELFFRGLVMRSAAKRWGPALGVVISSGVFGFFHGFAALELGPGLFFILVTALYGAVLAVTSVRCNWRLGPAIVGHVVINAVGVAAAMFAETSV